jgi:transcriptional regulator with XRE-family HTH domain
LLNERLRHARESRGATIEEVARAIGVRARLLELIEAGDYDQLPAGVYARSSVRAYASAMALNPDEAIAEVEDRLQRPEDPLDGLARAKGYKRRPARDAAAAPPAGAAAAVPPAAPPASSVTAAPALAAFDPALEAPSAAAPTGPRLRWASMQADWWRPLVASAIDGALLGAIEIGLIWLTVLACGTGVGPTLRVAGPAMALLFVLIASLYFILLGGVRNETLGTRLAGLKRAPSPGVALSVRAVLVRARHCFTRQMPVPLGWEDPALSAGSRAHRRAEILS